VSQARRAARHRLAGAGGAGFALLLAAALGAPLLAPYPPDAIDLARIEVPPGAGHPFGTDRLGRDVLTLVLFGARVSLAVGVAATAVAVVVGVGLGAVAGYHGGRVDAALMRLVDLMLAMPAFFLLVTLQALLTPSVGSLIAAVALVGWMRVARIVRGEFLTLRQREFTEAALALGVPSGRLIWRHLLPNAAGPIVVAATLGVADAILIESALSFLGLGVPPYLPSWGNLILSGQLNILNGVWWTALFPGGMLLATTLSITFLGDGIQQALALTGEGGA